MARDVMRRARCPRCPRVAFLFAEIGPASGQMAGSWQDRADWFCLPVLGLVRESLAEVGKMPCRSNLRGVGSIWHMSCPAGGVRTSAAAGRRPSGVGRVQDGSWGGEMQLDSAGLDGT